MTIASAAIMFFLVMDPLGNIPFFLAALKSVDSARQSFVVKRELAVAYCVMVVFLFAGQSLLALLQISEPALTIAGGVILFLIALRMVFPSAERSMQEEVHGEPFIVPLAIPYVAGPSLLASEILLMSREPVRWLEWFIALTIAWLASSIIILLANRLSKLLGQKGLIALERLTGMILVAIAIQMFLAGIEKYIGQIQSMHT